MIQQTVEEQNRALFWHRRKQLGSKPRNLMHESDQLLYWLEECLLQDLNLVPGWLMPRIAQLINQTDRGPRTGEGLANFFDMDFLGV